jgi:hypothetical protein
MTARNYRSLTGAPLRVARALSACLIKCMINFFHFTLMPSPPRGTFSHSVCVLLCDALPSLPAFMALSALALTMNKMQMRLENFFPPSSFARLYLFAFLLALLSHRKKKVSSIVWQTNPIFCSRVHFLGTTARDP